MLLPASSISGVVLSDRETEARRLQQLLDIMARLRDPGRGCPWDLQQDFASIAPYTLEEAYEVAEAIERNAPDELCDELGDLLFQVVFHAQMAKEKGWFSFADVVAAINQGQVHTFIRKPWDPEDVVAKLFSASELYWTARENTQLRAELVRRERLSAIGQLTSGLVHELANATDRALEGRAVRGRFGLEGKTVFGFVGFFLKVKTWHALEWFLPSFIEAVRDRSDVVLMLVGEGPGRAELEEIGRSMGFSDRLVFTGEVPNEGIPDYLDAMDAGVIPHTNEYRSPIKMFEYMAAGKPILAPRQEPVESIIGALQGRFLFETKSAESLKNTIALMLEERGGWPAIGEKLKNLARTGYTYEKHGETILRLLEQRAARPGDKPR